MARSTWRGFLKLSLVSCPIRLLPATTRSSRISFHNVNRATMNRIRMVPHDSATGEELDPETLVKGYETEEGELIVVEDEELDALQIESSRTIELDRFVDEKKVDAIYFETPYYLAPDGANADETFRVIRDAMAAKKQAGIGRVVLAARERLVLVAPRGEGMAMTTLRAASEVRPATEFLSGFDAKPDAEGVRLMTRIIEEKTGKFDPSRFEDGYQKALHAIVAAKLKGKRPPAPPRSAEPTKVIDLMAALKRSLGAESAKPAAAAKRAPARKTERKRKRA